MNLESIDVTGTTRPGRERQLHVVVNLCPEQWNNTELGP